MTTHGRFNPRAEKTPAPRRERKPTPRAETQPGLPPEEQLTELASQWPAAALVRGRDSRVMGAIVVTDDEIAARWNSGLPGHLALGAHHQGLVHVEWEGRRRDSAWAPPDGLELVDGSGIYQVWPEDHKMYRLALVISALCWCDPAYPLTTSMRWAGREDPAVAEMMREKLGGRR